MFRTFRLSPLALLMVTPVAAAKDFTLFRGHDAVCTASLTYVNNPYIKKNKKIEVLDNFKATGSLDLPPPLHALEYENFDFNNDGMADQVFGYEDASTYISGTLLYVVFGQKGGRQSAKSLADVHVFLCEFDERVNSASICPPLSQKGDSAGVMIKLDKVKVRFDGRYATLKPFRFSNKTYLVIYGNTKATEDYSAIIKPFGASQYSSVCLFKK